MGLGWKETCAPSTHTWSLPLIFKHEISSSDSCMKTDVVFKFYHCILSVFSKLWFMLYFIVDVAESSGIKRLLLEGMFIVWVKYIQHKKGENVVSIKFQRPLIIMQISIRVWLICAHASVPSSHFGHKINLCWQVLCIIFLTMLSSSLFSCLAYRAAFRSLH